MSYKNVGKVIKSMIVVRIWEGLGNQLFQYAYARSLQLKTGYNVYLDVKRIYKSLLETKGIERKYTLDKFHIKLPNIHNMERKYFFIEQKNIFHDIMFAMSKQHIIVPGFYKEKNPFYKAELEYMRDNQYLMGWFQSEKYFKEYGDVIRKDLRLKGKVSVSSRLRRLLKEENTVSVHIRRGDYKRYHNTLPAYYYKLAREFIENKVVNPCYIIFTDDIEWVKKELDFGLNLFYMSEEGLEDFEELFVMSKCRHNIIANSTFSWWGAWLNNSKDKLVVGPKMWVAYKDTSKYNILPDEWIEI